MQQVRDLETALRARDGEVEAVRCEVADLRIKLSRIGSVSAQQVSELEAELRARDDECKGLQRKVADLEEQLDAAARRMACLQVTAKAGTKEPGSGEYAGAAVDRTQNGHMEGHGGRADGAQVHSKAHSGPLQGSQGERERARLPAEDAQSRSKSRFPRAGSPNDHYDTKRGLLPKYQSKRAVGGATDPQNSRSLASNSVSSTFDAMDRNRDGVIDRAEWEEWKHGASAPPRRQVSRRDVGSAVGGRAGEGELRREPRPSPMSSVQSHGLARSLDSAQGATPIGASSEESVQVPRQELDMETARRQFLSKVRYQGSGKIKDTRGRRGPMQT